MNPASTLDSRLVEKILASVREEEIIAMACDVINIPIAKRFYISGFVKNPGSFVLDTGTTISQAIIIAGGLAERGSDRRIKVMRLVGGRTIEISVELDDKVQPNDEIKIAPRFF